MNHKEIVMVTFYTFFHHEKSKLLLNVHEKIFFWIRSKVFPRKDQLTDKYVTNSRIGKSVMKRRIP